MTISSNASVSGERCFIVALLGLILSATFPASAQLDKEELIKQIKEKKTQQKKKVSSADPCKDYPKLKICTLRKELPSKKAK